LSVVKYKKKSSIKLLPFGKAFTCQQCLVLFVRVHYVLKQNRLHNSFFHSMWNDSLTGRESVWVFYWF